MTIPNLTLEQRQALAELLETKDVDVLREMMELILDTAVHAQFREHIGAELHERTGDRRDVRNGTRTRGLNAGRRHRSGDSPGPSHELPAGGDRALPPQRACPDRGHSRGLRAGHQHARDGVASAGDSPTAVGGFGDEDRDAGACFRRRFFFGGDDRIGDELDHLLSLLDVEHARTDDHAGKRQGYRPFETTCHILGTTPRFCRRVAASMAEERIVQFADNVRRLQQRSIARPGDDRDRLATIVISLILARVTETARKGTPLTDDDVDMLATAMERLVFANPSMSDAPTRLFSRSRPLRAAPTEEGLR